MPDAPAESANELELRACGPADRARQVALFRACFKKPMDERALAWRYDRSPHGPSVSFLTSTPDGRGVSGYACSPRRALAFGDEAHAALAGQTGDVMTHPEWRKRGLFSALDRATMARTAELGWPVVFGLPNHKSAHIFVELGWREAGSLRTWSAVLRADAGARAALVREGRWRAWSSPLAALRTGAARRALRRTAAGRFKVRELTEFPPEVQELSRAQEREFAFMLRRDRLWLSWRFLETPSRRHVVLGVFDETGDFRGYAVVQPPRAGESTGWLVDLLVRGDEARAAVIAAALEHLERAGASLVQATAIDGSWWSRVLAGAGFTAAPPRQRFAVITWTNDPAHPLARGAARASDWYLTDGDRDDETLGG